MPHGLEHVIRPYQSPLAHGTILIPASPLTTHERATRTWGAKATMPPTQNNINFTLKCCADRLDEQSRENVTKRITGTDGVSYIDIARPVSMRLSKQSQNQCGDSFSQAGFVAQGISAALAPFEEHLAPATSPSTTCDANWNFSNPP